ncbi:MAG: class I SAM-dependent methyltransferase [Negativicutes bacterium]|nr:class I SAM-dependent methyltransferase [Negativicutes bacterium]
MRNPCSGQAKAFYNNRDYDSDRGNAGQPAKPAAQLFHSFCQALPPNGLIGDYGCGNALVFGRVLLQGGWRYLGIDHSYAQISYAAAKLPQAAFLLADFTAFSLPDAYFDGILLINSLQETDAAQQAQVLEKISRQLKRQAPLLMALPLPVRPGTTANAIPEVKSGPPCSSLAASAYPALLNDCGFCLSAQAELTQTSGLSSLWLLAVKQ